MSNYTAHRDRLHAAALRDHAAHLAWLALDSTIPVATGHVFEAVAASEREVRELAAKNGAQVFYDGRNVFADKTFGHLTHRVTAAADRNPPPNRAAKEARS